MPTYEYMCEKCEHEFEREQRISDAPIKTCPECRSRKVKKLISRTSFVLKGGGWYSDLYASPKDSSPDSSQEKKGEKSAGDSDSSASADGSSGSDTDSGKDKKTADSKKSDSKSGESSKTKSSKSGKSAA